ncbi:diacylglycerol kinase family protein [Altererythrobacter sp.]|nr:diacylglycerol kinase family protein [Altererythrobacter sp.]
MKMDLVYNPVAGSFRQERLERLVTAFEARGMAVTLMPTLAEGAQLSGQADLICVHGGDGTLRDTVQALGAQAGQIPLAIAPAGTINLVARELGYARDPESLAAQIAAAWEQGPDSWTRSPLYRLGDMPIVSCLSIGPDSHAVAGVSSTLKKRIGRYAYAVALLRQMRHWPRDVMHVGGELSSGEVFQDEAEAAIVSHGALYGGPFRLSSQAALRADSVELITLRRSTRFGIAVLMLAAMLRLPVERLPYVSIRTCRKVTFDRCVSPVQVDGDHMPDCAYVISTSGSYLTYCV